MLQTGGHDTQQHWGKCDAWGYFIAVIVLASFVVSGIFMAAGPPENPHTTNLLLRGFGYYPGPSEVVPPTGTVRMVYTREKMQVYFEWDLDNLDVSCRAQGPNSTVPLSCGIHIHEGTSCDEPTGAHFYDKEAFSESPWLPSQYSAPTGSSTVAYGKTWDETLGRALVLHDRNGTRIACQLIAPQVVVGVAGFEAYVGPNSTTLSPLPVGVVNMVFSLTQVRFQWDILNLSPDCLAIGPDATVPFSCGMHIHEGKSCTDPAGTGGHFFAGDRYPTSPWLPSQYRHSAGIVAIDFGEVWENTEGRTLVLHARDGNRVACAVIKQRQF